MHLAAVQESDLAVVTVGGTLVPEDLPGLAAWFEALLERGEVRTAVCDLAGLVSVDLVAVDALARLRLGAARHGCAFVVRDAPPALGALVELLGLADALTFEQPLRLEAGRQAEQREQARGVQEERDAGDPTA